MTWLDALTEKSLARELPTRAEALNVLNCSDDELMPPVPHTVTPFSAAAARSIEALDMPVVTSSRSRGSWPSREASK